MRTLRLLGLRRIRQQPMRALIAAISVAAGVSLAVTLLIVTNSVSQSVREHSKALAGPTPLRVIGATTRGGISPATVDAVTRADGVAAAVPLVQAVALVDTGVGAPRPILALGIDCRVEQLTGPFGCSDDALAAASAANAPPFISPSLASALHADAAIRTDLGRIPLAGATTVPGLGGFTTGEVAVFPLARAQELFARADTVDVVYVQPRPGVAVDVLQHRLEQVVGPANGVLAATDPPPLVGVLLLSFLPLFSLLTALGLGVGAVLVYNTVSLSVEERRRQLAIVGALGGSSRVIVGGTLVEAGALGLVGGVLGAFGGMAVAGPITSSFSTFTERVAGIPLHVQVSSSTFVIGALLGLVLGMAAAWRPARRAQRFDVAAELSNRDLRDESSSRSTARRALVWAAVAVVSIDGCAIASRHGGLDPWQAMVAPVAFVAAVASLTMLVATTAPLVLRLLASRVARRRASTRLALANLVREPGRTGVMAVALGLAVGIAFMTASYTTAVRGTIADSLTKHLHGVSVSTLEPNNTANIDAKLSADEVSRLQALPGVDHVERATVTIVGHETAKLIGVRAYENPWFDSAVLSGSDDRGRLDAGMAVIGPRIARDRGLRAGGVLALDTPNGVVQLPVTAVIQDGDFGGNNVTISYPLFEQLFGAVPPQAITLVPRDGVTNDELVREVDAAGIDPHLHVRTASQLASDISASIADQMSSFWALQRGLMVTAFVAVLSTLLLVGVQRRRELSLLAAVGMAPRALAAMVLVEAAAVAVVGVVLGVLAAVPMYGALLLVGPIVIGFREPFAVDAASAAVYGVLAVLVALAGSAWPAWRTSRVEVLAGLQYE